MPSMQEALKDAFDHLLAEPRRPTRQKCSARKPAPHRDGSSDASCGACSVPSLARCWLYRGLARIFHR